MQFLQIDKNKICTLSRAFIIIIIIIIIMHENYYRGI